MLKNRPIRLWFFLIEQLFRYVSVNKQNGKKQEGEIFIV